MKKMYRTMMLFSSTVVFLAVAPLVVLYAMGYRMGSSTVDPLPFGVVLVETIPTQAELTVDGVVRGNTPRTLSGLIPGEVKVGVSKEGYKPWEKTIRIEPGLVSEFRDIRLFPNQFKKTSIAANVRSFSLSPNRVLVAVVTSDSKLVIIDEEGKLISTPLKLPALPTRVLWAPDSTSLLILYKNSAGQVMVVADTDRLTPTRKALTEIKDAVWDPRIPGRMLLLTKTGNLKAYSYINDSVYPIAENIQTFSTSSKMIYAVTGDGSVASYALSGELNSTKAVKVASPIEKLLITPAGQSAVLTIDKTLYLLPDNEEPLKIAEHVLSVGWSPDGRLLYIQPEQNELYVYNASSDRLPWLPSREKQVIVRLSRPIVNPQWFAGGRHLIYQTDDQIMISEIDTRDQALQYTIDSTNMGNAQTAVGTEGERLFYLSKEKDTTSLTVLAL